MNKFWLGLLCGLSLLLVGAAADKAFDVKFRKPVAISGDPNGITVIADDGSIWRCLNTVFDAPTWERLPDIPAK